MSKPVSAPLPALTPGLSPFLPTGLPPPAAPALLGCCGAPACSLAEAQQELQVLRRQLGERERLPPAQGWCCLPCVLRGPPDPLCPVLVLLLLSGAAALRPDPNILVKG